jgi:hypothetical protein
MKMRISRRDSIATLYVALAVLVYGLWLLDFEIPGLGGVRAVGVLVLALGVAASATAVVPGFSDLLHGSRIYLGMTSLIGLGAFVAGIRLLLSGDEEMLTLVMVAMIVLWLMATIRHVRAETMGTIEPARREPLDKAA